ncbi:hypothetical protein LEP1GSC191_2294 [Leptospira borgpetersenii serovar Mini str. 201000851]|uniref:Uncharacterized protein n=2 Tax=Leptospira borgpetersenii TaxID=174 RepID=M3GAP8_LEPBO|nr:hypothetical protein LEP1GSC128_3834 [Leptospira borgpetersenii str. 200801926]EMF97976.1 hypothetical protein LEP1GSC123_1855 [Leptospira borgpetersenii str. 200701203]ENO65261.1 hypothetical protein LEP1GSC191_2294 [Leptospira borgpetersenii serovar Mini str. 201000851]
MQLDLSDKAENLSRARSLRGARVTQAVSLLLALDGFWDAL